MIVTGPVTITFTPNKKESYMNRTLLLKIRQQIIQNPCNFDYRFWLVDRKEDYYTSQRDADLIGKLQEHTCGTAGCVAGWAVTLANTKDIPGWLPVSHAAEKLLRLESKTAQLLFSEYVLSTHVPGIESVHDSMQMKAEEAYRIKDRQVAIDTIDMLLIEGNLHRVELREVETEWPEVIGERPPQYDYMNLERLRDNIRDNPEGFDWYDAGRCVFHRVFQIGLDNDAWVSDQGLISFLCYPPDFAQKEDQYLGIKGTEEVLRRLNHLLQGYTPDTYRGQQNDLPTATVDDNKSETTMPS